MKFSSRAMLGLAATCAVALAVLAAADAHTAPAPTPASAPKPAAPAPATKSTAPASGSASTAHKTTTHHATGPQELDRIAAVVNDDVVLQSDVDEQVMLFLQRNGARPEPQVVDTLRKQILDQMINEKLIVIEAKRLGLTVSPVEVSKQVDQAIGDARQRLGSDEAFRQQLAKENLTLEKLRAKYQTEVERQMLAQRLVARQLPRKEVTQSEAEAYFKQYPDRFPNLPAQVRLSVIQIPVTADSATEARGRAAALAARRRIAAGEKFAKVASELSEDPGSAKSGGDLGYFSRGAMEPGFENAAFSMPLNTVSEPVRTPFGWHLIEVLDRDTVKTVARADSLGPDGKPLLEAHARHILIRVQLGEADADRAHALAQHVYEEAKKGTDFVTLVHHYSKYEGQVGPDGDVGFVSVASLQDNIRAGVDTLETGQVSEPLVNQVGYNLFKLTDRKPARPYTLEEIRKDLPQAVEDLKQRERYDAWVTSLRAKAHVEIRS
ncbi:MAG: peptidylprolyl isomerase [Candidatus Eisenbacteria bacterium]|nr:peptidylprolyl isomerase [Candidatus Eisenbacteria bacterium]